MRVSELLLEIKVLEEEITVLKNSLVGAIMGNFRQEIIDDLKQEYRETYSKYRKLLGKEVTYK